MRQNAFAVGAQPRTRLGELTTFPQTPLADRTFVVLFAEVFK